MLVAQHGERASDPPACLVRPFLRHHVQALSQPRVGLCQPHNAVLVAARRGHNDPGGPLNVPGRFVLTRKSIQQENSGDILLNLAA